MKPENIIIKVLEGVVSIDTQFLIIIAIVAFTDTGQIKIEQKVLDRK